MILYKDNKYNFFELFNETNGFLFRSNIDKIEENPIQRSFPELLDIGIMGSCKSCQKGFCKDFGVDCYQKAQESQKSNMSFNSYKSIIDQCTGKVFQVALGGAGDPNHHENFSEILEYTRNANIVPNYTTSGYLLNNNDINITKKYCGAVAVSFYTRLKNYHETNELTIKTIKNFVKAEVKTNIHFVISTETIQEAIFRLKNNLFPAGINAVIFLLYKPAGYGKKEKVLNFNNIYLKELIELIENVKLPYAIGFDTCFTPALLKYSKTISLESFDFCEAARFSMYIDSESNAYPCSFDVNNSKFKYQLKNKTIIDAWNSLIFNSFRKRQESNCTKCKSKYLCLGGCTLFDSINLCNKELNNKNY